MVGETWVIFCVGEKETADKKSPFQVNVVELGRGDMRITVELYSSGLMMEEGECWMMFTFKFRFRS